MTTRERADAIARAVHARIGKAMQELATVAPMVQREHPFSAVVTMRGIIDDLRVVEALIMEEARRDRDGVPTESLICGACGEHEARCQCADACDVCGRMECDDMHEQDAAAYEPRARL